jgi:ABC-2 type transport system ATP-binding protein
MEVNISNVTKKINKRSILKNVSMEIPSGKCIGLIGPNGAGKTTLIRSILGLYNVDDGKVLLNNKRIEDLNLAEEINRISFLLDTTGLMRLLTVSENIEFFYRFYYPNSNNKDCKQAVDDILKKIRLEEYEKSYVKELSRGMKQRLAIGRTMVAKPKFFIMDEPYLGLDVDAQFFLSSYIQELKNYGCTILISAHDLGHMEKVCDYVYFIKDGSIVAKEAIPNNCKRDYLEVLYKKHISEDKYAIS